MACHLFGPNHNVINVRVRYWMFLVYFNPWFIFMIHKTNPHSDCISGMQELILPAFVPSWCKFNGTIHFAFFQILTNWLVQLCYLACANKYSSWLIRNGIASTETKMSSFWRNFNHWLHWKLSFWQLPVQPVMKISSKWRHFRFSEWNYHEIWIMMEKNVCEIGHRSIASLWCLTFDGVRECMNKKQGVMFIRQKCTSFSEN